MSTCVQLWYISRFAHQKASLYKYSFNDLNKNFNKFLFTNFTVIVAMKLSIWLVLRDLTFQFEFRLCMEIRNMNWGLYIYQELPPPPCKLWIILSTMGQYTNYIIPLNPSWEMYLSDFWCSGGKCIIEYKINLCHCNGYY